AARPLILMGRVSRDAAAWDARVALAEALAAQVVTDLKVGAAFPTSHPLHVDAPGVMLRPGVAAAIAAADVILSLDYVDLSGILKAACGGETTATVIQVSVDHVLHNGWSMDYQGHPPADVFIAATPESVVPALLAAVVADGAKVGTAYEPNAFTFTSTAAADGSLGTDDVALALRAAIGTRAFSLAHLPLSWDGACWPFEHPLDFLGSDGGGGIGAGPGIAVGAALALRGSGRLTLAVCGDGDFLMGVTALWTAVHYKIPLLIVVTNNRSYYNDEVHQERVARMRERPVGNKWIGQRMSDPDIDLAAMARAQGALGWGPVATREALAPALAAAMDAVLAGRVAVVDVRVEPGNAPAMAGAPAATKKDRG
ncbi:MAG: thiamine pyrophosphate-dependent enzyme, partial [Casimicrobiaceae bacterium]